MEVVKKEDIPNIVEALLQGSSTEGQNTENFKDWAFLFLLGIDLGMDSEKIKRLKEEVYKGKITDWEGLELIFKYWIEENETKATWNELISSFTSTTLQFPELVSKDYVTLMKQNRPLQGVDSMDMALQIDLTRDEIYKHLSFQDKANLRLVNRKLWRLTLPSWRKTVAVRICLGEHPKATLLLKDFCNLFTQLENGEWTEDIFKLLEFPFQNFKLNWRYASNKSPDRHRDFFWDIYAQNIVHLNVIKFTGDLLGLFRWIALSTCPKLEEFSFVNCKAVGVYKEDNLVEGKAENLKSFSFITRYGDKNGLPGRFPKWKLLEIAPNLQNLETDDLELLDGLILNPDQPRKLQKLTLGSPFELAHVKNFAALRRYSEKYSTIKNLTINNISLNSDDPETNARAAPFDFYCAIKNCAPTLTQLRLNITTFDPDQPWICDLAPIQFPELLKFEIEFSELPKNIPQVKFDFGSLKSMPKLNSLSITYNNPARFSRVFGRREENWLYNGPVNQFIPEGEVAPVNLNPLCLRQLKHFNFYGWNLEQNDFKLFREWFPNLKTFRGCIDGNDLAKALKALPSLDSITLTDKSWTGRSSLCQAKLDFEKIRIFHETESLGSFEVIKKGSVAFLKDVGTPFAKISYEESVPADTYDYDDDNLFPY